LDAVVGTGIYTPVEAALAVLRQRRRDPELMKSVVEFLGGDIPDYLLKADCFVLPRHIATPNNEALYVLEQARKHGALAVFSQDPKDKFTSVNNLKRRLARPEICAETPARLSYRKIDIVDVPQYEGKRLHEVHCRDGRGLIDFHNSLFDRLPVRDFFLADDSGWIDRNHRGDVANHYRRYLALFVTHGVLFEDFETADDAELRERTVHPLLAEFEVRWGLHPLIVKPCVDQIFPEERFYLAHPNGIIPFHEEIDKSLTS
jgi:hypothetical protein